MLNTIAAWLVFGGGLGVILVIDWQLRIRQLGANVGDWLPDIIVGLSQIVILSLAAFLAWRGTKQLASTSMRIGALAIQIIIGLVVYLGVGLWYMVAFEIDSL